MLILGRAGRILPLKSALVRLELREERDEQLGVQLQAASACCTRRAKGAQRGGGLWAGAKNGQFGNCRTCFEGAGWGPGRVFEPRHVPVLRHEHVVRRYAGLPRIHEAAEQHAARGERGVRGRVDDDGRFAAELGEGVSEPAFARRGEET